MPRIVEIIRRADDGYTEPFICRANDGESYFVKGRLSDADSMVREWVAGHLGRELELPIPEFAAVDIPRRLAQASLGFIPEVEQLGWAEGFGSAKVEFADVLRTDHLSQISKSLAARILVFDWWIANNDRSFEENNPNLLWYPPETLHVIDHNNAFGREVPQLSWSQFCQRHVFGTIWGNSLWSGGPQELLQVACAQCAPSEARACQMFGQRCRLALAKTPLIWQNMPYKWQQACPTLSPGGE